MNERGQFIWESQVRSYELDNQGIVNNANYLHYFDHARVKHLYSKGIDWDKWHAEGYDLVLVHLDMTFKFSLRAHEEFCVISSIEKSGKLRMMFHQKIFKKNNDKLIVSAINTIVCVDVNSGKAVMPSRLHELLFC